MVSVSNPTLKRSSCPPAVLQPLLGVGGWGELVPAVPDAVTSAVTPTIAACGTGVVPLLLVAPTPAHGPHAGSRPPPVGRQPGHVFTVPWCQLVRRFPPLPWLSTLRGSRTVASSAVGILQTLLSPPPPQGIPTLVPTAGCKGLGACRASWDTGSPSQGRERNQVQSSSEADSPRATGQGHQWRLNSGPARWVVTVLQSLS